MPAANVPLVIDQGEDWTTDIIWTDEHDEPVPLVHPCRLDVRSMGGQVAFTLETNPETPEGEIPGINVSTDIGLLQLHASHEVTAALAPGVYHYDLFVTCDDENEYAGLQRTRLLYGSVTVNKRVTVMV